jgi:hypothetical protein
VNGTLNIKKVKRQSLDSLYVIRDILKRKGTPEMVSQVEEVIAKKEGRA